MIAATRAAAIIAMSASWRLCLLVFGALILTAGPSTLLLGALLGPGVMVVGFVLIVSVPASIAAHEFGHALLAVIADKSRRSGRPDGVEGRGRWLSAAVVRPRFPVAWDVRVTLAGPIAGTCLGILAVLTALAISPSLSHATPLLLLPFMSHVAALGPRSADGAALRAARRRKDIDDSESTEYS